MKHSYDLVMGAVFGCAILLLYYFSALIIDEKILPSGYRYVFQLVIAVVGAFSGAWFAFELQNRRSKKDAELHDVTSANNAIFELSRWYNKLHALKTQFIDAHRTDPCKHLLIKPVAGMALEKPKIDYESLSFIFKSSRPNILGTIALAEQEIASTLDVIMQRSKMHVEILQPVVERLEKRFGPKFPSSYIEKEIGTRNLKVLKMLTDYMVQGVDDSISALSENMKHLKAECQSMYPDYPIVGMIEPPSVSSKATT